MGKLNENEIKVYDILIELDRGSGVDIKEIFKKSDLSKKEILKAINGLKNHVDVYECCPKIYKVLR